MNDSILSIIIENLLKKKKRISALCILNFRGTAEILNVLMEENYYG